MSFESLGLDPTLLSALAEAGFATPTSVQAAAIPQALAGQDLMVSSQTGSGKTAAFMLPALHRIAQQATNPTTNKESRGVQVLVLTPTRELALQIHDAARQYGKQLRDLRCATVVGGMPYNTQIKALSRRVDILVATPGRLIDHLQSGRVKLNTVHTLVLDEADRMLDMGFIEDIETIISRIPSERQTLLFSATLDGTVTRLAKKMMRDPQRIEITSPKQKHANITQNLLYADDASHKIKLLNHLLRDTTLDQAIVFTSTKRGADNLATHLADQGFLAAALHGDMNQRQRTRTLGQLQRKQLCVLVATDVAARGIDIPGVTHVVNFDLPMQAEDYVHRCGRTGRAGRDGSAFILATHAERHKIRGIELFIGQTLAPQVIQGLEPKRVMPSQQRPSKPTGSAKRPHHRGASNFSSSRLSSTGGSSSSRKDSSPYASSSRKDSSPYSSSSRKDSSPYSSSSRKDSSPYSSSSRKDASPYANKEYRGQSAEGNYRSASRNQTQSAPSSRTARPAPRRRTRVEGGARPPMSRG